MEILDGAQVKCFLCGEWIRLRPTKGGKPHGFCRCGLELFFRREEAIQALEIALKSGQTDVVRSQVGGRAS
jgi:hypothetical protein